MPDLEKWVLPWTKTRRKPSASGQPSPNTTAGCPERKPSGQLVLSGCSVSTATITANTSPRRNDRWDEDYRIYSGPH